MDIGTAILIAMGAILVHLVALLLFKSWARKTIDESGCIGWILVGLAIIFFVGGWIMLVLNLSAYILVGSTVGTLFWFLSNLGAPYIAFALLGIVTVVILYNYQNTKKSAM